MVAEARARLSLDGAQFDRELKKTAQQSEKTMGPSMKRIGAMVGAAFSVGAIVNFARSAMATADAIDNMAKEVDVSAESVQVLKNMAEDAGVSFETLRPTINQTRRAVEQAKAGNTDLTKAFETLGISIDELRSMNTEQMFERVSSAMSTGRDSADVMAASTKILGSESTRLLPIINELGDKGFGQLNAEMKAAGRIIDEDLITSLDRAEKKVSIATEAVKNQLTEWAGAGLEMLEAWSAGQTVDELRELEQAAADLAKAAAEVEKKREAQLARITEENERQKSLLQEITALETELIGLERQQETALEQRTRLVEQLAKYEAELAGISEESLEANRDQLDLQIKIKKTKAEIAGVEKEIEKENEPARKAREQHAKEMEKLQARYNGLLYDQMPIEERVVQINAMIAAKKAQITDLIERGHIGSKKHMEAVLELADLEDHRTDLLKEQVDGQREVLDITEKQVENIKAMREQFQGMSREDIKEFVKEVKFLAEQLNGIVAPEMGWISDLESLNNIRFSGLTPGQAKQMADAIKEFVSVLKKETAGLKIDMAWIKDLEAIANIKFTGLTRGQASQMAGAIKELADGLKGIGDMKNLGQITDLIEAIGGLGPGGKHQIEITLPQGMSDGFPLVVPQDFNKNLSDLAKSTAVIAKMKGVSVY